MSQCNDHEPNRSLVLHETRRIRLYESVRIAIRKCHRLDGKQQKCIASQSGGWKTEIEVSGMSVPLEGCEGTTCSRPFPLAGTWGCSVCFFTSSYFYVCLSWTELGPSKIHLLKL